ncbi:MAG: hypothetical protein IJP32_11980, partial [Clostridia bacterium]|nr:hypothetical protein [Clostridia bacterium]
FVPPRFLFFGKALSAFPFPWYAPGSGMVHIFSTETDTLTLPEVSAIMKRKNLYETGEKS